VGVATAKVFAYAVGAEVLGINTLETIAASAPIDEQYLWVVMDAQRGDVVVQAFSRAAGDSKTSGECWLRPIGDEELLPVDLWLSRLTPGSVVAGPILHKIAPRLPSGVVALPSQYWLPRASQVARLAARNISAGLRDDLWKLSPVYVRRAAAEEVWEAKNKAKQ
jgi:tRNA threonylcarbamoyladenosine biosynthesis protein TsaB